MDIQDLICCVIWEWEISQVRKRAVLEEWEELFDRQPSSVGSVGLKPLAGNQTDQSQPDQNSSGPCQG